jgi:hypothetical protein
MKDEMDKDNVVGGEGNQQRVICILPTSPLFDSPQNNEENPNNDINIKIEFSNEIQNNPIHILTNEDEEEIKEFASGKKDGCDRKIPELTSPTSPSSLKELNNRGRKCTNIGNSMITFY